MNTINKYREVTWLEIWLGSVLIITALILLAVAIT